MKWFIPRFIFLVTAILAVLLVAKWLGPDAPGSAPGGTVTTHTDTIPGDSIPYEVAVPVPVARDSIVHDTAWMSKPFDTAAVLTRFFTEFYYCDTIRDSSFLAIIQEVISQNRIIERNLKVQNLRPQAIITNTTTIYPAPAWLIGPSVTFGTRTGFGASSVYIRKRNAFGSNIDATNRTLTVSYMRSF